MSPRLLCLIVLSVVAWSTPAAAKKVTPKKAVKSAKAKPSKAKAKPAPATPAVVPAAKAEPMPALAEPVNEPPPALSPPSKPAQAPSEPEPAALPPRSRPAAVVADPTPPREEPKPAEDDDIGLVIGFSGGLVGGLSPPLGLAPQGALELGYRLPFFGRALGLSVEPTFMMFLASTRAGVKTDGLGISIPLLVSLNLHAGPGLVRVLAGPTVAFMQVKTVDTLGTSTDTTWVFGLHASAGYWFELPVGAVFGAVDFKVLPYAALAQNKMYLGLGGRLGYAFLF